MSPHQERVIKEREQLDSKRQALMKFMGCDSFRTLEKTEQSRLLRQLGAMTLYFDVLSERITAFHPRRDDIPMPDCPIKGRRRWA